MLINHGLWNWLSSQTQKKIESDLTTPVFILQHLQPLHIITTSWINTLTSLVKNHSLQRQILKKYVLLTKKIMSSFKTNLHLDHTQKTSWFKYFCWWLLSVIQKHQKTITVSMHHEPVFCWVMMMLSSLRLPE